MFCLRNPREDDVRRCVEAAAQLPLTYASVGIARSGADGFTLDSSRALIGRGKKDFDAAVRALFGWRAFDIPWVRIHASSPQPAEGTTIGIAARHLGFYSVNLVRVVYVVAEEGVKAGFAYGTTEHHAECGEELFLVERQAGSEDVWYEIRAASRQRHWLSRLGYPYARMLQARFRRDSIIAMRQATGFK